MSAGVPVRGAPRASWEARGGLAKLGAPVSQAQFDPVAAGAVWTQTFTSVKLEVDASLPAPEVADVRESAPPAADDPCRFARGGDKTYCENVLSGADPKTLYTREGTLTVATRACPKGCSWKGVCEP